MGDARELVAAVPIRCCARVENLAPFEICGEPARWLRPNTPVGGNHFCDVHREPSDQAIAGVADVRRISVCAEVVFNGTLPGRGAAEAEAVERLLGAVAAAGGAISLVSVASDMGRQHVPLPAGITLRRRGRR